MAKFCHFIFRWAFFYCISLFWAQELFRQSSAVSAFSTPMWRRPDHCSLPQHTFLAAPWLCAAGKVALSAATSVQARAEDYLLLHPFAHHDSFAAFPNVCQNHRRFCGWREREGEQPRRDLYARPDASSEPLLIGFKKFSESRDWESFWLRGVVDLWEERYHIYNMISPSYSVIILTIISYTNTADIGGYHTYIYIHTVYMYVYIYICVGVNTWK